MYNFEEISDEELEAKQQYFLYLWDIVESRENALSANGYHLLGYSLFKKQFYWLINMDENRAADGRNLRIRYADFALENGSEEEKKELLDLLSGPCSVLEMMIGLAIRCEDHIMYDPKKGDRTSVWFWEMIENLGLLDCCNSNISYEKEEKIDYILTKFLDRDYDFNGNGGLFPLKNAQNDQKNVEFYYQLCAYLQENWL